MNVIKEMLRLVLDPLNTGQNQNNQLVPYNQSQHTQITNMSSSSTLEQFSREHLAESSDSVRDLGAETFSTKSVRESIDPLTDFITPHLDALKKATLNYIETPAFNNLYKSIIVRQLIFWFNTHFGNSNSNMNLGQEYFAEICRLESVNNTLNILVDKIEQKQLISEPNWIVSLASKLLGESQHKTVIEVIQNISDTPFFENFTEAFQVLTANYCVQPIALVGGFFTFKKIVQLYADVAFKDQDLTRPDLMLLRRKQIFAFMVLGAALITCSLIVVSSLFPLTTIKTSVNLPSGESIDKMLPFLSFNKLTNLKVKKTHFLMFILSILFFVPNSIIKLIISYISFSLICKILVVIYVCLILFNVLTYLFIFLLSKNLLNLTDFRDSSNYFATKICRLEKYYLENLELHKRISIINIYVYIFCLLYFVVILWLI